MRRYFDDAFHFVIPALLRHTVKGSPAVASIIVQVDLIVKPGTNTLEQKRFEPCMTVTFRPQYARLRRQGNVERGMTIEACPRKSYARQRLPRPPVVWQQTLPVLLGAALTISS
jgi:hypothetical protein